MEFTRKSFHYSVKNIPIPSENNYLKNMLHATEQFLGRLRWRVFYFDRDDKKDEETIHKETFGFNTSNKPPPHKDLAAFENDLFDTIPKITFNRRKSLFQQTLTKDTNEIKRSNRLIIPADKTRNMYEMNTKTYSRLLHDNITKHYKRTSPSTKLTIDKEAKSLASHIELEDRIECIAPAEAFITIKDHKDNFPNNPTCRLINPAKSELGIISKHYLQDINQRIRAITKLEQWQNTKAVISWFTKHNINSNNNKRRTTTFMQLDITDFYASISEELFDKAVTFAKTYTHFPTATTDIIKNARQSLLFQGDSTWVKKSGAFDVTMGAYDGAEVCELVGLYILHTVSTKLPNFNFGLYRDDGLGIHRATTYPNMERTKKMLTKIFKDNGLQITIQTNLQTVDFLDTTFCLQTNTHKPYRKPGNDPIYINTHSNHPATTLKQIPIMIQNRISALSSNETIFNEAKHAYEKALKESGYKNHQLIYQASNKKVNKRKRHIIWYNPPYNSSTTTNIGKQFLNLLDKHFPPNHRLHKIINRSNTKLSYSCSNNMKTIINNHNKHILSLNDDREDKKQNCNCRNKQSCPLQEQCQTDALVYKATITTDNSKAEYIGSTETTFKTRYNNHKSSFKHQSKSNQTKLATHYWDKINEDKSPNITWSIAKKSRAYKCGSRKCELCLNEKLQILMYNNKHELLNKRSELMSKCRHSNKYKLKNI